MGSVTVILVRYATGKVNYVIDKVTMILVMWVTGIYVMLDSHNCK